MNKKAFTTQLFIMGAAIFFTGMFIFFSFAQPLYDESDIVIVGTGNIGQTLPDIPVNSSSFTIITETTSSLSLFLDFITFDIEGLPDWITLVFFYLPSLALILGIILLIRGI